MIKPLAIGALLVAAAIALTSCASAPQPNEPSASTKEAGARGARLCFTNSTSIPMTATPTQQVESENAHLIVGAAGALSSNSELCFAGWNSFRVVRFWGIDRDNQIEWYNPVEDVSVSVGIDGHYNALNFIATNFGLTSTYVYWTNDPKRPAIWDGEKMSVGESYQGNSDGHSFTVTRREDSEFYKEFTVNFTP